jgi:hypothetical protein
VPSSIPSADRVGCRAAAGSPGDRVLAGLLWAHGPIGQWADYHVFADRRAWLGLPNAADVLSNLPFLAIGVWALWRLRRAPAASPSLAAWRAFAVALVLTAVGSAIYHWAPSNASLVGDRLPIAWACAALASPSSASGSARTGAGRLCWSPRWHSPRSRWRSGG